MFSRWCVFTALLLCLLPACERPDPDRDGDGFPASSDCDDGDAAIHPGAEDVCNDGIDQDCFGGDNLDCILEPTDWDHDGYTSVEDGGDDCDDWRDDVYPGAVERPYDGVDQDCDGADLNDLDNDGAIGTEAGGGDCDDEDSSVFPDAEELPYDGIDQNCDGSDLVDVDQDGFVAEEVGGDDCDDGDPATHPGAEEHTNDGVDHNCDGLDNPDDDQDGVPVPDDCDDADGSVFPGAVEIPCNAVDENCDAVFSDRDCDGQEPAPIGNDCNDNDPTIYFGALELACNDIDEDCDGLLSDQDCDGDQSYLLGGIDCDDLRPDVHPSAPELFNSIDDNCNGEIDERQEMDDARAVLAGEAGSLAGTAVAVGDVNGDGIADVAIGAPGWMDEDGNLTGAVFIVEGGSESGLDELAFSNPILIFGLEDGDRFGAALAIGDVDGDGENEVIIGAPDAFVEGVGYAGNVYIIPGSTLRSQNWLYSAAVLVLRGAASGDRFGAALAVPGDVNKDGIEDILVGAPAVELPEAVDGGAAYLFLGMETQSAIGPADAAYVLNGKTGDSRTGTFVAGLGDISGDDIADLAISSPGAEQGNGRITILFGKEMSEGWEPGAVVTAVVGAEEEGVAGLGPVARAGDLNGDGYADLLAGAPQMANGRGMVFIKYGPLDGATQPQLILETDASASLMGEDEGGHFGTTLMAGVMHDDGYADIFVGAPQHDGRKGAVYYFTGQPGGVWGWDRLAATADAIWQGSEAGQTIGSTIAAGDMNNDGWQDLMIGVPGDATGGEDSGAVFAFQW